MPTLNELATILTAIAAILTLVGVILNTFRQSVHSTKLDVISADVATTASAVDNVATRVREIAATQPPATAAVIAPVPMPQPPIAGLALALPSGAAGVLGGHSLGQGFIDLCQAKGWQPETDENYTALPGASVAVASGGLLVWSPAAGPRAVSFD